MLKAGEHEAIVGWFRSSKVVVPFFTGVALALAGAALGVGASVFIMAFIDLN